VLHRILTTQRPINTTGHAFSFTTP